MRAIGLAALVAAALTTVRKLVGWATSWGSTPAEQGMSLPGDTYLDDGPPTRAVMTRAISIAAPPDVVWPWLAQLGRGAGWYSYDRLDNGGRVSARHIVSWIPDPAVGDASAIGWLRHLEPGRELTWWIAGEQSFGTKMRMVIDIRLRSEGDGSRLIMRVSGDATGPAGRLIIAGFRVVDSFMAIRQLKGAKTRAETFGDRAADPGEPETGARDQYQLYETIWASGERAGIAGREHATLWRADAAEAGVIR